MTIEQVRDLLNKLLREDPLSFYKMTLPVYYGRNEKEYSVFGILNLIFGNDNYQLGYHYDKNDLPIEVVIISNEEYFKLKKRLTYFVMWILLSLWNLKFTKLLYLKNL